MKQKKNNFERPTVKFIKETDKLLLLLAILASAYGLLMVYSATLNTLKEGQLISSEIRTMVIAVPAGIILAIIISIFDYKVFVKLFWVIGGVCIALMVVTLLFGKAPDGREDSAVWLKFGSFYFQASELVKIGFIVTFAVHLESVKEEINSFKNVALLILHAAVPIGLVVITGDDGSALVFIFIFACMMIAAGLHWLYFVAGGATIAVAFPIMWATGILRDFQKSRFLALIYYDMEEYAKDQAYQQNQAINAMGSGGATGKGLFKGGYIQSGSVPEAKNDFILSVAGEELGFIGALAVLLLITAVAIRVIRVGKRAKDGYGYLMCMGIASMFIGQMLINAGMVLRWLPVIGITLPFFSAGGSSNLCVYIAIGLVPSIYRTSRQEGKYDIFYSNKPIKKYS